MANVTTDNGIPGYNTATPEEVRDFNIDSHMIRLLLSEPFFAEMMRNITKVRDESIPTAGVCVKDSDLYLYWGPLFMASCPAGEIIGLLKHEVYHLVFQHCTSRRMTPHNIHNIATDLAINSIISEDELPKCGLRPGKAIDLSRVTDPKRLEELKKLSDKIAGFPLAMASDWYFSALMDDPDIKSFLEGEGDGGTIEISMDGHEGWGEMSDEERQVVQGKIKAALKGAVGKCDRNGSWGSVSGEVRETLRKLIDDSVDWKKVLQNFVGSSQRIDKSNTIRKINRKYPYIHPGVRKNRTATVAVFVDMSGSVSDADLEQVYGTLGALSKAVSFKFFPFDWTVDEANAFEWKKNQTKPPIRFRSGGTSFIAVNDYVKKHRSEFDGVVICTDGGAEDPGPSPLRRAWVLVPGTTMPFKTPNDIVVKMDKARKAAA